MSEDSHFKVYGLYIWFITCSLKKDKTKVLSVQLGKTFGLTKVPITETEENAQVRKKILFKTFLTPRGEGGGDHQGGLNFGV